MLSKIVFLAFTNHVRTQKATSGNCGANSGERPQKENSTFNIGLKFNFRYKQNIKY